MDEYNAIGEEESLLYEQDCHVSAAIASGVEPGTYRCINTNPDKNIWVLSKAQKEYVRQCGLQHLAEIDYMRIDHALITGLVERWRPETNTFHLHCGEATITLEDVAYIYGLPIDGPIVTGRTFPKAIVPQVCEELLGMAPCPGKDTIGVTIKFKWLEENFKPSKNEIYKTRAYLFCLVNGQIIYNASGARGQPWVLELFREFKPYAWGPACLANLYRMLGKAVTLLKDENDDEEDEIEGKKESRKLTMLKTLTGPLQLIQIWAYSRMAIGRCPPQNPNWNKDIEFPLFKTWEARLKGNFKLTTLKEIRQQLNNFPEEGFNWQPYTNFGKKFLSQVSKEDHELFTSHTILLYYWISERHSTGRVMKQFGLRQVIPPPVYMRISRVERVERMINNYSIYDDAIEDLWNRRRETVLHGKKDSSPMHREAYLIWYGMNTILSIGGRKGEETTHETKSKPRKVEKDKKDEDESGEEKEEERGEETKKDKRGDTRRATFEGDNTSKHVLDFLNHLERSSHCASSKNVDIDDFTIHLRKKIGVFKSALASSFVNYNLEESSSSQSSMDKEDDVFSVYESDSTAAQSDLNHDAVAKVLTHDSGGRVHGLGTSSSKTAKNLSASCKRALEEHENNTHLQTEVKKLKNDQMGLRREMEELKQTLTQGGAQLRSSTYHGNSSQSRDNFPRQEAGTNQPNTQTVQRSCRLLDYVRKDITVAHGRVLGLSTEEEGCYRIIIDEILKSNVQLLGGELTFGDLSCGDIISWPIYRTLVS